MMKVILDFLKGVKDDFNLSVGRVLEVGSYDVNGSPRSVFQSDSTEYIGVDMRAGNGVDVVHDAEKLLELWPVESFDTIICCECLEHTIHPWLIVDSMRSLLKPGGYLYVSTPTYGFPLHRFPVDCYRFGEDAYRLWLFDDMKVLRLAEVRDEINQPALVAVGQRRKGG